MLKTMRIFVSSPGDVGQERACAARVIKRLASEYAACLKVEPYLWEEHPLKATAHFQDRENIEPPSQSDIFVCILWSRLGTRLPEERFHRMDGTPFSSGTEWEFEDAVNSHKTTGVPDLYVYRKTAQAFVPLVNDSYVEECLAQKKALQRFLDRWFRQADGSFKAAFAEFNSLDQFEAKLEKDLRESIEKRIRGLIPTQGQEVTWCKGSPFRGLEPFDFEHAPVYFGRTRAIGEIKEKLVRQASRNKAFLLILGNSGCGKSSLVCAGVLPNITGPGVVEGVHYWRWQILLPSRLGRDFIKGLAEELLTLLPHLGQLNCTADKLGEMLRKCPDQLSPLLTAGLDQAAAEWAAREALADRAPSARLCLVIDQLEEVFSTTSRTTEELREFFSVVGQLARSGLVWIIATMRSEYYARCMEIPELADLKQGDGQYDLVPPTPDEFGQMIRYPSRAAGLRFEVNHQTGEHLEAALLQAACQSPKSLPLLQFTLQELFRLAGEKENPCLLTWSDYASIGGLEGSLARRAEEVYCSLETDIQTEVPRLLLSLAVIDVTHGAHGRRMPRGRFAAEPRLSSALGAFIEARLLVSDKGEADEPVVGLAHDALLASWPRLLAWINGKMDYLRSRARLGELAAWWNADQRKVEWLLKDTPSLREAEAILITERNDLDTTTTNFIETSIRQHKQRGRAFLIFSLVVAVAILIYRFGSFCLTHNSQGDDKGLTWACWLALFFGPVAIKVWKKCRPEPYLALLKAEARLYGLALVVSATVPAGSYLVFRGTSHSSAWILWAVVWTSLVHQTILKTLASGLCSFSILPIEKRQGLPKDVKFLVASDWRETMFDFVFLFALAASLWLLVEEIFQR